MLHRVPRIVCLLLFIFIPAEQASAQQSLDLVFWESPISKRLSQSIVTQSFQDSTGALWLATQEGLNRYDGKRVEIYRSSIIEANGLAPGRVIGVKEDITGKLWVATQASLQRFISHDRILITPRAFQDTSFQISDFIIDSESRIWLATNVGLKVYLPKSEQLFDLELPRAEFGPATRIAALTLGEDDTLYIATDESGVHQVTLEGERVITSSLTKLNSEKIKKAYKLLYDNGTIWIATLGSGIFSVDVETREFRHIKAGPGHLELPSNTVNSIIMDKGRLWVATSKGLAISEDGGRTFNIYASFNEGLADDSIYSVYKTRDGTFWLGTQFGLVQGRQSVTHTLNSINSNIPSDWVNAVKVAPDGTLWVGTERGVGFRRPAASNFEYINKDTHSELLDETVMAIEADDDIAWIGTFEGGLYRYTIATQSLSKVAYDPQGSRALHSNGITSLLAADRQTVIVGTFGGGLSVVNRQGQVIRTLQATEGSGISDVVLALQKDIDGGILVGHEKGLAKLDPQYERITDTAVASLLTENHVATENLNLWEVQLADNNDLWLGTYQTGLLKVERDSNLTIQNVVNLSLDLQLPSLSITGIHKDGSGKIWLSHNGGLTRFDPATMIFQHYSSQFGLTSNEFTMGASTSTPDGQVYFGGTDGLAMVETLSSETRQPKVELGLSSIKVMDRFVSIPNNLTDFSLALDYEDKIVTIEFFGAEFIAPEDIQYAYRIQGLEDDWIFRGNERTVSLTTLPPGQYELELAAKGTLSGWNWEGKRIPIVVNPPWWTSNTAYASYLLGLLLLITLFFWRYRASLSQAQARERELALRVRERTEDLEKATLAAEAANQSKSEFLAVMSHEIRTPLHGIIGMNELLLNTNVTSQQRRFGQAALNSGKTLLHLINEILDLAKIEADAIELEHVDFDLIRLVDEICYLQGEPAQRKGLQLDFIPSANLADTYRGDPQKIRQVLTNVIGNATKFTDKGRIIIRADVNEQGDVEIEVNDTGIGIPEESRERIFEKFTQADASTTRRFGGTGLGLTICKNFVSLMGGQLNIHEAAEGEGTCVKVSLPLEVVKQREFLESGSLALVTRDDSLAESLAIHGRLLGYDSERVRSVTELSQRHFVAILADETLPQTELDLLESAPEPRHKFLLTSIRSLNQRLNNQLWAGVHRPVTIQGLADAFIHSQSGQTPKNDALRFSGTILVAEDNKVNQLLVNEILQEMGFSVFIADNGQIAADAFEDRHFDLILMDCQMPVMDGFAATQKILEIEGAAQREHTPIIALTAAARDEEYRQAMEAGMDDFMTKPFNMTELEQRISHYIQPLTNTGSQTWRSKEPAAAATAAEAPPEDSSAEAVTRIINEGTLRSILAINQETGGTILVKVIDSFLQQLPDAIDQLRGLVDHDDTDTLRKRAHALKSMSLNVGADALADFADALEQGAKQNVNHLTDAELEAIEGVALRTVELLTEWKQPEAWT